MREFDSDEFQSDPPTAAGRFDPLDPITIGSGEDDEEESLAVSPATTGRLAQLGSTLIGASDETETGTDKGEPRAGAPTMPSVEQPVDSNLPPLDEWPEWDSLTGEAVEATPAAGGNRDPLIEVKRSRMSVDCLEEARTGNMQRFSLLTNEQRDLLHEEARQITSDPDAHAATTFVTVTHDILKNKDIHEEMGLGPEVDHDEGYTRLLTDPQYAELRARVMPTYDLLSDRAKELAQAVASVRSNYPQTLQGEAPGLTLEAIHNVTDPLVRDIDILVKKFDIFGALGHVNSEVSLTATPGTFRRMTNLDQALRDPNLATPQDRYNAFLDAELKHFMGPTLPPEGQELAELRTLARLECHLRINTGDEFRQLRHDFAVQPDAVKEIIYTELSRENRATLADHSPLLFRTLTARYGGEFAIKYIAHVLQEAHIADLEARQAGLPGITRVPLGDLTTALQLDVFDPRTIAIRFRPEGDALVAVPYMPSLGSLDHLPEVPAADLEALQGKRILLVGEGGGTDGDQAAALGLLLSRKYGCEVAAVASVRNEERQVTNTGEEVGIATHQITPKTQAVGDWRFVEQAPLEGSQPVDMYILNSTDPAVIRNDVEALLAATNADIVIGVDTGGDSLYRTLHAHFSAREPAVGQTADITPDQDYTVIQTLAGLAEARSDTQFISAIVAPGVDSPSYADEVLNEIGAARLPLDQQDAAFLRQLYAEWRLDGSGNSIGRFGKTPLAWLHALQGNYNLQLLDLPRAHVLSTTNPWRAFTIITPAMANIVFADMRRHFAAIERQAA